MGNLFSRPTRPAASRDNVEQAITDPRSQGRILTATEGYEPTPVISIRPDIPVGSTQRGSVHYAGTGAPDSAKAGIFMPMHSSKDDTNTTSATIQTSPTYKQSPEYQTASGYPAFPKTDTILREGQHPITKEQVFETDPMEPLTLRVTCPSLINELQGTASGPAGNDYVAKLCSLTNDMNVAYDSNANCHSRRASVISQHAQYVIKFIANNPDYELVPGGEVSFEHLCYFYKSGSTVFKADDGGWRAYKVDRVESGCHPHPDIMCIRAYYLDFNSAGDRLVPQLEVLKISRYSSARPIGCLEVVPDWYIWRFRRNLEEELKARGRKFWQFNGKATCQEYMGDTWPVTSDNQSRRVIIDYTTPSKHIQDADDSCFTCPDCLGETLGLGPYPEAIQHDSEVCIKDWEPIKACEQGEINNDKFLLFCPPKVWAFSLTHNSWGMIPLLQLEETAYQKTAWSHLQLDPDCKAAINSMASSSFKDAATGNFGQTGNTAIQSDARLARDRGRSILLVGRSGMGKTFTVECLAEKQEVPLYRVNCGSLGAEPDLLEARLRESSRRASDWGAILLLDEVNFFVREQDVHHVKHSVMYLIFRRFLEQPGVLVFLTASRDTDPDQGFGSRCDLMLGLPSLDFRRQRNIWHNSIEALEPPADSNLKIHIEDRLGYLHGGCFTHMNGWQIQSCIRAAVALARGEEGARDAHGTLNFDHVKTVLEFGKKFSEFWESEGQLPRWQRNRLNLSSATG